MSEKMNVLFIITDALRMVHLQCYGNTVVKTPNIDRFAEVSTVFHRHYAAGNFTVPSTGSLIAGTYPWTHRALHLSSTMTEFHEDANLFSEFDVAQSTILAYTHNIYTFHLLNQII